jgi:gliding motility-associated-like protein
MEKSGKLLILVFLFLNLNLFASKIRDKFDFEIGLVDVNCNLDNAGYSVENALTGSVLKNPCAPYSCSSIATAPPTVKSPVYYCKGNANPSPLTATFLVGATHNWYLTNAAGEIPSTVAPTPNTTTVGQTTYYVTQTIGNIESTPRTAIVVNVVSDTGAIADIFRCDPTQATTATSVFFDWSHVVGRASNYYEYAYTIQGNPPVFGNTDLTHLEVFGLLPGQTVTFTILTVLGLPCYPTQSMTCNSPCGATSTTPTFPAIPTSYCINEVPPILPSTSTNSPAITGSWNPLTINTSAAGITNYVFTPDPVLYPCATKQTLSVKVGPVEPNFSDFSICSGKPVPSLNSTSPNGITGIWTPLTIDNVTSGAYVFTPNPGQLCTPTVKTIIITVNPSDAIVNLDWTVTAAFTKNQIVTVTEPVGVNYLYQLDDGTFQESPIFENVSLGTHSITVKDVNGCSELRNDNVLVIDYPKFFTPNNDTYNDTWNIFSLRDVLNARILIFDRYGKLLKEISPSGSGWDGTYIGQPMPANDYWFTVDYTELDIPKKFKSHFSLKR